MLSNSTKCLAKRLAIVVKIGVVQKCANPVDLKKMLQNEYEYLDVFSIIQIYIVFTCLYLYL